MRKEITWEQALDYELRSSFWACWISNSFLQNLTATYYSNKVRRKMKRYNESRYYEAKLKLK